MTTTTETGWGPDMTPKLIRQLIFLTAGVSLFSALSEFLLQTLFGLPGLSYLFSLSWQGWKNYYLWQIVTYLFLEDTGGAGPSFSFLVNLAFNMYLLWVMGSDLFSRVGQSSFLRFYFGTGIFAGVAALVTMSLLGVSGSVSGPAPAILAVLTAWTLFNPNLHLYFLFLFRIQAKWLWAALVAAVILIPLSHLNWLSIAFYGAALLFGYSYAVMAWEQQGPFSWMWIIDRPLSALGRLFKKMGKWRLKAREKGKIIDFQTGEPRLEDDQFVDAMLEKISKQGKPPSPGRSGSAFKPFPKTSKKENN